MYYAKSTNGFYTKEIHGGNMPSDAVEIDDATHAALMAGQTEGKEITSDTKGRPVLTTPAPTAFAVLQAAELAAFRELREGYLNRLTGIGLAAQLDGDADTLAAAVAMRRGLLDMTDHPAVVGATTLPDLQAALKNAYAALVAAVPTKLREEFKKVGA